MSSIGNVFSILILCCILLQDFRARSISAWLLPAMVCGFILSVLHETDWTAHLLRNGLTNVALLALQFVCLWLFVSAKKRSWTNIINTQIGIGDILLLICLAPFFSPVNFFVLYTFSIVLALIVSLLQKSMQQKNADQIPFAAYMAMPLIALCGLRLAFPSAISFCSDEWVYTVFAG